MRVMTIRCNKCGGNAKITSSAEQSAENKNLYCACKDVECGHTFVMTLAFSHTLSPSALDLPENVREKIKQASPAQQRKLFAELTN